MKATFSEALKRVAAKFGVGRYLYRLPAHWYDWDHNKKHFTKPPHPCLSPSAGTAPAASEAWAAVRGLAWTASLSQSWVDSATLTT